MQKKSERHFTLIRYLKTFSGLCCLNGFLITAPVYGLEPENISSSSKYERVLMTQLRDKECPKELFRQTANRLAELLIYRVVEYLPTSRVTIETPLASTEGEAFTGSIELVSIMRSGDALLDRFSDHFPKAAVSKILIQRDEETATPVFKYKKLSRSLNSKSTVIITEPMIATGGTLGVAIDLLKENSVLEENIIIASILAAPEGLKVLAEKFPRAQVVVIAIDEKLNEKMYIVPGLGDFGDRFFGN